MKARQAIVTLLLLSIVGGGAYYYWRTKAADSGKPSQAAAPAVPAVPVNATRVERREVRDVAVSYGDLRPRQSVPITPYAGGQIVRMNFTDGTVVNAGTPLVQLDDRVARARMQSAQASATADQKDLSRSRDLVKEGLESRQAFEQNEARAASSRTNAQVSVTQLEQTLLRAPFTGTVGARAFDVGAYVNPGDRIVTLEDRSVLRAEFRLPESYFPRLKLGETFALSNRLLPDLAIQGTVDFIDPRVASDTRSILVRGTVPNPTGRLLPGLFFDVRLTLAVRSDALVVPVGALITSLTDTYVYRIDGDVARRVAVKTGAIADGVAEIVEGLKDSDQVVVTGQFRLRDGAKVSIVPPKA